MKTEFAAFGQMEAAGWKSPDCAEGYAELFASASDMAIDALVKGSGAAQGHRALDVCCGQGNVSEALAATGAEVTGLDFSAPMLAMARERVPGATFVEGDAGALPFEDRSFDAATNGFGMLHVPDPAAALSEARRVLRPGGRLAVAAWCPPDASPAFRIAFGAVQAEGHPRVTLPPAPDMFAFGRPETSAPLFEAAGFEDVRTEAVASYWTVGDPAHVYEIYRRGTVRFRMLIAAQPPENAERIAAAIAEAVRDLPREDGGWRVDIPCLVTSAAARH